MKKTTVLTIFLCLVLVTSLMGPLSKSSYVLAQEKNDKQVQLTPEQIKELQVRSQVVERVRKMLQSRNVPFDPSQLFSKNWRTKLAPAFDQMPEMQQDRSVPLTKIRGVGMANELVLPANFTLTGHTVILARRVKFDGQDVHIKGPFDIHFFVTESIETKNGGGTITIDTSGFGKEEWLEAQKAAAPAAQKEKSTQPLFLNAGFTRASVVPDTINQSGTPGSPGGIGSPGGAGNNGTSAGNPGPSGTCMSLNGGDGTDGDDGDDGTQAGNGGNGGHGGPAGAITAGVNNPNSTTTYILIAKGGNGGDGGTGGPGGTGGVGQAGGPGGPGASCSCKGNAMGNGGDGGWGGWAGSGGRGGNGGNGGNGGPGGPITFTYAIGYNTALVTWDNAGGTGGLAGAAGNGGPAGFPGSGGSAGAGGSLPDCSGANGTGGSNGGVGSQGAGGNGGNGGNGGQTGGTPNFVPIDTGGGGGGGGGSWEPGGYNGYCTDWWVVWYHCVPLNDRQSGLLSKRVQFLNAALTSRSESCLLTQYTCFEVDRWYAGCW